MTQPKYISAFDTQGIKPSLEHCLDSTTNLPVPTVSTDGALHVVVAGIETINLSAEGFSLETTQLLNKDALLGIKTATEAGVIEVAKPYNFQYGAVGVDSAVALGPTGAVGDYLHRVIINVTGLGATVAAIDGVGEALVYIEIMTSATAGIYSIELNLVSVVGGWSIMTGSEVTVIAVGIFTA